MPGPAPLTHRGLSLSTLTPVSASESERTFSQIYATKAWGGGSGFGSRAKNTRGYRRFVETFVAENPIRSVLDFGCGDWNVSRAIDWGEATYLGLDVVPNVFDELRAKHARPGVEFARSPDDLGDLPAADLLIVKDVLQHWPNAMIGEFLNVAVPRYRYALITNDLMPKVAPRDRVNPDIRLGGWRHLDVRAEPFNAAAVCVSSFYGPIVRDPRRWRMWGQPLWTKMILLMQDQGVA